MIEGAVEPPVKPPAPGGHLQAAVTVTTNVLWSLYRAYFSGVVSHVVPEHTRDACFQLFCDLRANTPKERRFLTLHARAFTPRTASGWLALASALGFSLSGAVALACTTVAISIAGVWSLVGLAIASGIFLASVLTVLSFSLFVAALVSGAVASGALMMYLAATATFACLRLTGRLLLGSPSQRQQQQQQVMSQCSAAEQQQQLQLQQLQQQQQRHPQALALPHIRTKSPTHKHSHNHNQSHAEDATASPVAPVPSSPRKLNPAAAAAAALSEPHTAAPAVSPAVLETVPAAAAAANLRPSPFGSTGKPSPLGPAGGSGGASSPRTDGNTSLPAIGSKGMVMDSSSSGSTNGGSGTPPPVASGAPLTPHAAVKSNGSGDGSSMTVT